MPDIIDDALERIHTAHQLPAKVREQVEKDLRADWGGERTYVCKQGEDAREKLSQRDAQIRREFRRGEREAYLARRHGISVKRVRQILQCSGDMPTQATEG